jgi:hypothetical protein
MDATEQAIVKNEAYSVRQFSPTAYGGFIGDALGFLWPSRADLLPRWGSYECDMALRVMHYTQHNSIWGGGVQAFIEKFLSIPYEISGGRNLTFQWQELFFEAEFGEGYDELVSKGLVDYLTLNRGWFMEKVSYGEPDTPIREGAKILGINHLDAMRIRFTGNREWPYLYQSEWGGKLHKMHHTRVIHIARQPSPDTLAYGMGKSALYDSLSVANSEILLGRHQNELLNDLPPPGIVIFNNVKADEVQDAMKQFEYERVRDGQSVYRAPLSMSSKDPAQPATVTFIPMATVPSDFDKAKYTQTHVNIYALNLGLDPQDIWPLSSGSMGSGEQSKVLAAKTDIKGPGYVSTRLTRIWNTTMPKSLEWKYKAQNAAQDKETANLAQLWVNTANTAKGIMSEDEVRQLIANQVPAFADVLLDEDGQVRLFDADPKTPEQVTATDDVVLEGAPAEGDEVTTNSENETVIVEEQGKPEVKPDDAAVKAPVKKEIDATNDEFIQEMTALIQDGLDRVATKAGTASRIRGAINRYGKQAYIDGLVVGGVPSGELDEDDRRIIGDLAVRDSQYVTNLVNEIYSEGGISGTAEARAQKWMGTTDEFYYEGIASADKNGMYEFKGDDGNESCKDCRTMKGQKHRMAWWIKNRKRPGVDHDSYECKGYNCQHYLERVKK